MDAAAGFGLSSFYSSVADAEMEEAVAVWVTLVVAVVTTMAITANGLSFSLFSSAAAETMVVPAAKFFTGAVYAAPSYI